jgi:hypothetical protein
VIVVATVVLEVLGHRHGHGSTPILYDKLELLRPDKQTALLEDLSARTGFPVFRVQIHRVDLLRDAAEITAYYRLRE